jgi:hypothetical protein
VVTRAAIGRLSDAFFQRCDELSPDLLKVGFNFHGPHRYGVHPVSIRGERIENVALLRRDRYIGGKQISSNRRFHGTDGAPVRLFHARPDQELPDPQGAR